jgi:3-dehydroquinate dehydratase-1
MICVSLAEPTVAACLRALEGRSLAEVRLERMRVGVKGVRTIFSRPARLIATCRPGRRPEEERLRLLLAAVDAGAAFVDIELGSPAATRRAIVRRARGSACRVIVSHHDFERTPPRASLERTIDRAFAAGADIVKIACLVRAPRDNARLLGLLDGERPLIVVGMGPAGRITRVAAPFLGGVLTYAADDARKTTAPGQMTDAVLERLIGELKNETGL